MCHAARASRRSKKKATAKRQAPPGPPVALDPLLTGSCELAYVEFLVSVTTRVRALCRSSMCRVVKFISFRHRAREWCSLCKETLELHAMVFAEPQSMLPSRSSDIKVTPNLACQIEPWRLPVFVVHYCYCNWMHAEPHIFSHPLVFMTPQPTFLTPVDSVLALSRQKLRN